MVLQKLNSTRLGSLEPFDGTSVLNSAVYLAAQRAGIKVVLDGATSDGLFASDFHEAFLVREGRWRALWREADGLTRFWGPVELGYGIKVFSLKASHVLWILAIPI